MASGPPPFIPRQGPKRSVGGFPAPFSRRLPWHSLESEEDCSMFYPVDRPGRSDTLAPIRKEPCAGFGTLSIYYQPPLTGDSLQKDACDWQGLYRCPAASAFKKLEARPRCHPWIVPGVDPKAAGPSELLGSGKRERGASGSDAFQPHLPGSCCPTDRQDEDRGHMNSLLETGSLPALFHSQMDPSI